MHREIVLSFKCPFLCVCHISKTIGAWAPGHSSGGNAAGQRSHRMCAGADQVQDGDTSYGFLCGIEMQKLGNHDNFAILINIILINIHRAFSRPIMTMCVFWFGMMIEDNR